MATLGHLNAAALGGLAITIQFNSIQFNSIQFNSIQFKVN
ncbi:hypothetical protein PCIT_a2393 [Pseudoalteromonas citrea]|uniref:Uncharacterized protein n=1 Tax=Pseudoalteromonas citrea TaxID=43655 RepID=A0AAD4AJQ2_9GAMM|nr:hypothetical protein PCIT_a2393 [Pseudoalteromonas citrea]